MLLNDKSFYCNDCKNYYFDKCLEVNDHGDEYTVINIECSKFAFQEQLNQYTGFNSNIRDVINLCIQNKQKEVSERIDSRLSNIQSSTRTIAECYYEGVGVRKLLDSL
jgi:hypothetical protein